MYGSSPSSSTYSQRRDDRQRDSQPVPPLYLGSEARPGGSLEAIEPRVIDTLPVGTSYDDRDAVLPTYTPEADPAATELFSGLSEVLDSPYAAALMATRRPKRTPNYGKPFLGGGQPVGQPYVPPGAPFGPPTPPTFDPYNPTNTNRTPDSNPFLKEHLASVYERLNLQGTRTEPDKSEVPGWYFDQNGNLEKKTGGNPRILIRDDKSGNKYVNLPDFDFRNDSRRKAVVTNVAREVFRQLLADDPDLKRNL
jgi:hypothetical protein